ncbi:hypothetical protein LENED_008805 [Lentinula edodes]|uniref:Uncharacterized protein n=1 Tax=Lentinula edodes TaxID=5353 RepID=A0A1Q3EI08_LENED|nr:hypothetical protein LENED_008805 [Lentinula edodes]
MWTPTIHCCQLPLLSRDLLITFCYHSTNYYCRVLGFQASKLEQFSLTLRLSLSLVDYGDLKKPRNRRSRILCAKHGDHPIGDPTTLR